MTQTDLYRHFDKDDNLLYVGISSDALSRFKAHKKDAVWVNKVVKITIEKYPDRATALEAEKDIILTEKPANNIKETGEKSDPQMTRLLKLWGKIVNSPDPEYTAQEIISDLESRRR